MLSCQQLTELVTDYLERRMPLGQRVRFRLHLATCPGCRRYLHQMQRTVAATGQLPTEPLPAAVKDELMRRFRNWRPPSG